MMIKLSAIRLVMMDQQVCSIGDGNETQTGVSNLSNQSGASASFETLKELLDFTLQKMIQAASVTEENCLLASGATTFLLVHSKWGLVICGTITRKLVGAIALLFLIVTNITIVMSLLTENKDPNARAERQAGWQQPWFC